MTSGLEMERGYSQSKTGKYKQEKKEAINKEKNTQTTDIALKSTMFLRRLSTQVPA